MNWANVLVVGTKSKTLQDIGNFMYKQGFGSVSYAFSAGEARRMLTMRQIHMVVMSIPLQDDPSLHIIEDVKDYCEAFMIMIGREEHCHLLYDRLEEVKGIVLQKPLNPSVFAHTVKLMKTLIERNYPMSLTTRLSNDKEKLTYIREAKKLLMDQLQMSEPQAHRYIQKMAMNVRLPKELMAQIIVSTYGDGNS